MEKMGQNIKLTADTPKNESELTQMIMMGKFIRHLWVNYPYPDVQQVVSMYFFCSSV